MLNTAQQVLDHYGLDGSQVEPYGTGLINDTFLVTTPAGEQYILQGLNPVFQPEVNLDIDALTRHLYKAGVTTKRLLKTTDDKLWVSIEGRNWRVSTFIAGECFDQLQSAAQAAAAGALLGEFHHGVKDLGLELHTQRLGVHDTQRHLANLRNALETKTSHPYYSAVSELAAEVLSEAERLPLLPELPDRLVHGDPKISNLVFSAQTGAGVCMIDLDTITYMPLPLEMGDAFRSWCNPRGEDQEQSQFRLDLFGAAVSAYADVTRDFVAEAEWRAFVSGARIIMIELAARFTTDALNESYFGWNPDKFKDRSTHNQVRARGQLELEKSLAAQVEEAEDLVARAFAGCAP
jgi:Ser/Thr protein kinase RdoA (MazF antagonist)